MNRAQPFPSKELLSDTLMNIKTEDDMKLPEGKTCADCAYYKRCWALFECPADNTECDWAPSRFRQHITALVAKDGHIVTPTGKRFRIEEADNI